MKINTDGVLLGALASLDGPSRILDIGTGTGVIALMLAQRHPLAAVDAIEIDSAAANAARANFASSPYADRMASHGVALEHYTAIQPYDLMVSNPPYFLDSLKNQDARKQVARHTDRSFFTQLLDRAAHWLAPNGSLQLVLPVLLADEVSRQAEAEYGLTVQATIAVRSFAEQLPIRRMLAVGKRPLDGLWPENDVVIYESRGVYTPIYRALLADFFMAF